MKDIVREYKAIKKQEHLAREQFYGTHDQNDFAVWRKLAAEAQEMHTRILVERGLLLSGHTHPELTDAYLRCVLANELRVLRRSMRSMNQAMNSEEVNGVRVGLDTFARRIQDIQKHGWEFVYPNTVPGGMEAVEIVAVTYVAE